jgi:hypothetical protein
MEEEEQAMMETVAGKPAVSADALLVRSLCNQIFKWTQLHAIFNGFRKGQPLLMK